MLLIVISLREKCPNKQFFWSVFSCIRTEYGDLLRKPPEKTLYLDTFHAVSGSQFNDVLKCGDTI